MAKFSMKKGGKEVGPASVYAPPHTMTGSSKVKLGNGYSAEPSSANTVDMSVGGINRNGYNPAPKTTGTKMRGTGAATKGLMSRGPMA
jgi:hypothetical protein